MPVLDQVVEKYPKDVKIVFKNYPIPSHKFSQQAATAALAAGRQGKFWEYHDKIFANFKTLNDSKLDQFAKELGLDMKRFEKDRKDPAIAGIIQRDMVEARQAGIRGTPSIFVNGKQFSDRSLEGLSRAVEEGRKK